LSVWFRFAGQVAQEQGFGSRVLISQMPSLSRSFQRAQVPLGADDFRLGLSLCAGHLVRLQLPELSQQPSLLRSLHFSQLPSGPLFFDVLSSADAEFAIPLPSRNIPAKKSGVRFIKLRRFNCVFSITKSPELNTLVIQ
jgi:hypothetical protein